MPSLFVDHPAFAAPAWNSLHPLAFSRHSAVRALAEAMGWLRADEILTFELAGRAQLLRLHDADYVDALAQAVERGSVPREARERFGFGTMENPIFPGLFDRARATVAGSVAAARAAMTGSIVFHPAGGTHHGRRDRASGFCYFNDPAFAILTFLDCGLDRIFYLDLDAHHGDGVELAFANDERVRLASIYEEGRWPHTGTSEAAGPSNASNFAVPRQLNDSEFLLLVERRIAAIASAFSPQAIVITAGADCLHGDPLSTMEVSNRALWRAAAHATTWAPRSVVLGGGGYNPWTVARGWAGLWATLSDRDPTLPPTFAARDLLTSYRSDLIDDDEVEAEWLDSIADTQRPGPVRAQLRELAG